MDAEDRALFERSIRYAVETSDVDGALAELGWHEALPFERHDAVSILFEAQGHARATSSALDAVLLDALGIDQVGAVLLPAIGQWTPPGRIDGGRVVVDGLALGARDQLVVVATTDDKDVAAVVSTDALTIRTVHGMDPSLGLVEVRGTVDASELTPVTWETALAVGQLALGHELVGASRRMLELAREHALERVQFDRPISQFQAIRHRLAETHVAIEGAQGLLDAAWEDGLTISASMAKAYAGRAARITARHCQQVLAGIGFTTEHPLHLYVKRILVLEQLLGGTRPLTTAFGRELLATRKLPPLLPL